MRSRPKTLFEDYTAKNAALAPSLLTICNRLVIYNLTHPSPHPGSFTASLLARTIPSKKTFPSMCDLLTYQWQNHYLHHKNNQLLNVETIVFYLTQSFSRSLKEENFFTAFELSSDHLKYHRPHQRTTRLCADIVSYFTNYFHKSDMEDFSSQHNDRSRKKLFIMHHFKIFISTFIRIQIIQNHQNAKTQNAPMKYV